jgi:hypothetical protein
VKVGDLVRVKNTWPRYNSVAANVGKAGILLAIEDGDRGFVLIGDVSVWIFMMDLKKI